MRSLAFLAVLLVGSGASAVEESDLLFYAPFEDSSQAVLAVGEPAAEGAATFGEGRRGRAARVDAESPLTYPLAGNVNVNEGTIMMWVKPEWSSADGPFQHLFRASTGNFGGKALNAILLYKYLGRDHLLFYTSDGQETEPQNGRTLARQESLGWSPGEWVHVAASWSATLAQTEMTLYLNGERVAAAGGAVFVPDQPPPTFELGGPSGSGVTWFDDVMVFSRPLLPLEIAAIYQRYGQPGADPEAVPFASTQEVQLTLFPNLGDRKLVALADARGARRASATPIATAAVRLTRGEQSWPGEAALGEGGLARVEFAWDEVGPGPVEATVALRDPAGRELRRGSVEYEVPAAPAWLGNQLGISDEVLPPFTPIQAAGDRVGVWGRDYRFGDSPLPVQVTSAGRDLLRGPIRLTAGGAAPTGTATAFVGSPSKVARDWTGALGPVALTARQTAEFDGFLRFDLRLVPSGETPVGDLTLTIPLQPFATLHHRAAGDWSELSDAGAIGEVGWSDPQPFVPYWWVGDESGGLAWWCESAQGWRTSPERALELRRTAEGVDLIVHLIDSPATLTEPLALTFGFIATPVKPMPAGWRNWRPMFISALNLESFAQQGYAKEGQRDIGALWNNHIGSFSHLPTEPEALAAKVRLLREHGWDTPVTYFAMNYTQTGTPEFRLAEKEWRRNPYTEAAFNDTANYASVCAASTWPDFLLYAIDRTMDEAGTDGVYLDCCNPNFCRSAEHGCAPGRYPILATRELLKRIATLVHQKRGEAGMVYNHNSENNLLTTYSFSDLVLNGEQYNKKPLAQLTAAKFRAELSPQPYGVPAVLLPTLVKFQPPGQEKMPGAEFLAFPLLHDVLCVSSWLSRDSGKLLATFQNAMFEFGVAESEFLPYWSNADRLDITGARVSAYHRPDGGLLLVGQVLTAGEPGRLKFTGDLASLAGQPIADALSGEPVAWDGEQLVWPPGDRAVHLVVVGEG